tara:strand:- start:297 stop:512 length:216 start_codon:yes stop_codon:yes gene_type:complete
MDKFIILTGSEVQDWGPENVPNNLYKIGTDGKGIFGFTTVPNDLSSKTVYTKSQINAMLRDNSSPFYTEGY